MPGLVAWDFLWYSLVFDLWAVSLFLLMIRHDSLCLYV